MGQFEIREHMFFFKFFVLISCIFALFCEERKTRSLTIDFFTRSRFLSAGNNCHLSVFLHSIPFLRTCCKDMLRREEHL